MSSLIIILLGKYLSKNTSFFEVVDKLKYLKNKQIKRQILIIKYYEHHYNTIIVFFYFFYNTVLLHIFSLIYIYIYIRI